MDKWRLNHKFYRTIDFWFGLFFVVTDVKGIVPQGNVSFGFFLDLGGLVIGIILILSALLKKVPGDSK
jgi:hypothetical protein